MTMVGIPVPSPTPRAIFASLLRPSLSPPLSPVLSPFVGVASRSVGGVVLLVVVSEEEVFGPGVLDGFESVGEVMDTRIWCSCQPPLPCPTQR